MKATIIDIKKDSVIIRYGEPTTGWIDGLYLSSEDMTQLKIGDEIEVDDFHNKPSPNHELIMKVPPFTVHCTGSDGKEFDQVIPGGEFWGVREKSDEQSNTFDGLMFKQ